MKLLLLPVLASVAMAGCGDNATTSHPAPGPETSSSSSPVVDGPAVVSRKADNSATNKADGKDALTPLNQGSGDADTQETAKVRKAIMADKSMSINAQNIKIITVNGKLTLRGTVNSIAERDKIDQLTREAIGSQPYDDQLNVTQIK